jgi:hypothetical protein
LIDYGGLPSVTQMIERCNNNHNICSQTGKEELAINAWMTSRSILTECTSVTTIQGKRPPSSGPDYVRQIYDNLDTLMTANEDIRRNMPVEQQAAWEKRIEKRFFDKSETFSEKMYQDKKKAIKINKPVRRHRPYAAEIRTGYQKLPFAQKKTTLWKARDNACCSYARRTRGKRTFLWEGMGDQTPFSWIETISSQWLDQGQP